jgi:hypothetical protein
LSAGSLLERANGMSTPSAPGNRSGTKGTRATEKHRWTTPLAVVLILLYLAAAWTIDAVRRRSTDAQAAAHAVVTFADSASYTTALAEVTSIGMRLGHPCVEGGSNDTRLAALSLVRELEDSFAQGHTLGVATTVLAPADWVERLWTLPHAVKVNTSAVYHCPIVSKGDNLLSRLLEVPPAERPVVLDFPRGMAYGEALRAATDMGLRLADPCYEAALARGDHPAWHPASQEQAYGSSGSLVVAPTILTPDDWLNRLASGVTPGPVVGCASS